jgi:hypothetical protein
MRYLAIFFTLVFALSAAVQLNDPDPMLWFLAYVTVAVLWGLAAWGRYYRPFTVLLLLILTIWMLTFVPDFVVWMQMGMPTIVGSMKAEEPHIELVREFGGLFLMVASLVYLLRIGKRKA